MIIIAKVMLNISKVTVKIISKLEYFISKVTESYDCFESFSIL